MALKSTKSELSLREQMALRVLAMMYRLLSPNEHSHRTDRDLNFIFTGKEVD